METRTIELDPINMVHIEAVTTAGHNGGRVTTVLHNGMPVAHVTADGFVWMISDTLDYAPLVAFMYTIGAITEDQQEDFILAGLTREAFDELADAMDERAAFDFFEALREELR